MAKTITWGLTAGRSWWSGEKMTYDETILHHIRHDANFPFKTLYGGTYETLQNFAAVRGDKENKEVEGQNLQISIALFINMWELFKQGKFEEATMHWNPVLQAEYLKDLRSERYLKYWMSKI